MLLACKNKEVPARQLQSTARQLQSILGLLASWRVVWSSRNLPGDEILDLQHVHADLEEAEVDLEDTVHRVEHKMHVAVARADKAERRLSIMLHLQRITA